MARSYDIAELMTNDGEYITDNVRRKINGNFRRVLQIIQQELPSQERQVVIATVNTAVENALEAQFPAMLAELFDRAYPVGSVIVCTSSADSRLSIGSWQQIGNGRYIRAAGGGIGVMDESGSDSVTITSANIPVNGGASETGTSGLLVSASPSVAPEPIEIEPEYIALLFYRRIS